MTQLAVAGVSVEFGATTLFKDITFTVGAGRSLGNRRTEWHGQDDAVSIADRRDAADARSDRASAGHSRFAPRAASGVSRARRRSGRRRPDSSPISSRSSSRSSTQAARLEHDSSEAALDRYGKDLERFEREGRLHDRAASRRGAARTRLRSRRCAHVSRSRS